MRRPVGMAIRVAIEAGHAPARLLRAAILGLVELLLRKRRHQKTQALELLRIDDAVEQLIIILEWSSLNEKSIAPKATSRSAFLSAYFSRLCRFMTSTGRNCPNPAAGDEANILTAPRSC